jgi:hypothetical protein
MKPEKQRIAIAEACGWRGQPVEQSWKHKAGFSKYWRSIPISQDKAFDFFSAACISRVLLDSQNKPVFRKVYCGVLNNRDSYHMLPIVEYFQNENQYKPWPIIEQSLVPFVEYLPDYLHDLNAMQEAMAHLEPEQVDQFAAELSGIVLENREKYWWDLTSNEVGHVANATAAQRAEAFLRTIGKWEEEG